MHDYSGTGRKEKVALDEDGCLVDFMTGMRMSRGNLPPRRE